MTAFPPIAIVGRGCVLPGALSPEALWELVRDGRDVLTGVPPERWGLSAADAIGPPEAPDPDRTWSDRGGYVRGFEEVFDSEGFRIPPAAILRLDPLFRWVLHAAREALAQVGHDSISGAPRCGAVIGNLSFPSLGLARFAEGIWRGLPTGNPYDRFVSGLPAHLLARALGLGAGAFALDAACASSLYAIKLACDRLHDGTADRMIAGGVNGADDLFIHVGFCSVGALSRSGRCRPFHREADGLVPAEGAAVVVLERLDDALRAGHRVLGVIRGVGLSNDGRERTLLTPSIAGQARAMQLAYEASGIAPGDVSLIECHATGTPVGDGIEIRSMSHLYAGRQDVPIGSVKSNLGHLITAAGAAGLLKVLGAIEARTKPPTLHAEDPLPDLRESPFRLLHQAEPWEAEAPRLAAVSAFGFGGNNAHLILEEWTGQPLAGAPRAVRRPQVAIVGLGARVAGGRGIADFAETVFSGTPRLVARPDGSQAGRAETVQVALDGLRFPPRDLHEALPQQLLMLEAAREAVAVTSALPRDRTGIYVGMGCDAEIARYGARWRVPSWAGDRSAEAVRMSRDAFRAPLTPAGLVGVLANMPANRISSQLDIAGPSLTVSAEEASGIVALGLAARALEAGELDAAIVGAVDLSCEPVHEAALRALGQERIPGDGAVAFVLKRLVDARRDGDEVLAILGEDGAPCESDDLDLEGLIGHAHAASGLIRVAAAVLRCHRATISGRDTVPLQHDARSRRRIRVEIETLEAPSSTVVIEAVDPERSGRALGARAAAAAAGAPKGMLGFPAHWPEIRVPAEEAVRTRRSTDQPLSVSAAASGGTRTPARWNPTALGQAGRESSTGLRSSRGEAEPRRAGERPLPPTLLSTRAQMQLVPKSPPDPVVNGIRLDEAGLDDPSHPNLAQESRADALPGPKFSRQQLEHLASDRISTIFGRAFEHQDGYPRQVRMPEPPLLLVDRVTGIHAVPGSMGTGAIWTETDIGDDAWYLHTGRMPAGIMIESGQADLLLISWLGIDWHNRGERVYRLLGCEATWHGPLPQPGERLVHEIHIDGHAQQGDIRLFFFHSDCRVDGELRMSIRGGQAGFFTDAELAASRGVLWDPAASRCRSDRPVEPPVVAHDRRAFDAEAVRAFAVGDLRRCFGPGFEIAATHVRTPGIQAGRMQLVERVEHCEPTGGPWGRGYLKASLPISPDSWFFAGHFRNDPCMPGTLMFEGCLQAMAFYLAAQGFTLKHDGWRFEPVAGESVQMRCRGQVTPGSCELTYEVFVEDLVLADGIPVLYADLLCSVDGLRAFHARRVGLKLVPDWPLEEWRRNPFSPGQRTGQPVPLSQLGGLRQAPAHPAAVVDCFPFDYASLLACAWGKPSRALGPLYRAIDDARRIPRLPAPPFLFISRIVWIDAEMGGMRPGGSVEVEYDLPDEAWYFEQNAARTMPFSVLLEAVLQPCGWLASFMGGALCSQEDLLFRNLDGTGTVTAELIAGGGTLRTRVTCLSVSRAGGMVLQNFAINCILRPKGTAPDDRDVERPVFRLETGFGFFPERAFDSQPGLAVSPDERACFDAPGNVLIDLAEPPASAEGGMLRLAGPMLRMIDRVDSYRPTGGRSGLGYLRARKDVDPGEWFFKAHFFQDPVQPGSLGIEAFCQLLQFHMIQAGMAKRLRRPRFESLQLDRPVTWKYRGQVAPTDARISIEMEVTEQGQDERGPFAVAEAWLWADDRRIYHAKNLGMRIVEGEPETKIPDEVETETVIDLAGASWLGDHRPNYTVPTLPLAYTMDRMAAAALALFPGCRVIGLRDVRARQWIVVGDRPARLRTRARRLSETSAEVTLLAWREAATRALSRFEPAASAIVVLAGDYPAAPSRFPDPPGLREAENPYRTHRMFHGPAFQRIRHVSLSDTGSRALYDADPGEIPTGVMAPALLDAALHAIPYDQFPLWCPDIKPGQVGFPSCFPEVSFFEPPPTTGEIVCTVLFTGYDRDREVAFNVELATKDRVWARLRLLYRLFPLGPIGMAPRAKRKAFLERRFEPGIGLSRHAGEATYLSDADVRQLDWLPGTVSHVYGLTGRSADVTAEVAIKEHVARRAGVHPSEVACDVEGGSASAIASSQPLIRYPVRIARNGADVAIADACEPLLDAAAVSVFWEKHLKMGPSASTDLMMALFRRFVRRVLIADPTSLMGANGRGVLFLANHQVTLESFLFYLTVPAITGNPLMILTRAEHQTSWVGGLEEFWFSHPGVNEPPCLLPFDRQDHGSLPSILDGVRERMARGVSLLVHVEGACALRCRRPVEKVSSVFGDFALAADVPIVPVRFAGGVPLEPLAAESDFPVGFGSQDYYFGRPILPGELRALPYAERRRAILAAINGLGPPIGDETPNPGDPDFAAAVTRLVAELGVAQDRAVLIEALSRIADGSPQTRLLQAARVSGRLVVEDDERGRWLTRFGRWLFPDLITDLRR